MPTYDEPVSVLKIYSEPLAVLKIATPGPYVKGRQGDPGVKGDAGKDAEPWPNWQTTWSPDTRYDEDDAVSYDRGTFVTNGLAEVGVPPYINGALSSGWYWYARPGNDGQDGKDADYHAAFDAERIYLPGDLVTFNNKVYISKTTSEDFLDPTHTQYWTLFSSGDGTGSTTTSYKSLLDSGTSVIVNHNLGTEYVDAKLRYAQSKERVYTGFNVVDDNNIEVTFEYDEHNPVDGTFHITVNVD